MGEVKAPEVVKPGYKTTEFWLSVATSVIGALYASGFVIEGGTWDKFLGLAVVVLSGLGYTVSRSMVKK